MADSRTGVAALLVNKEQQVLLQQRDDDPNIVNPGVISLFGGGLEADETALQATHREISEETNLKISEDRFLFFKEYEKCTKKQGEERTVSVYVATEVDDVNMVIYEGAGVIKVDKFTDLTCLDLTELSRQIVSEYFKESHAHIGN